MKDKTILVAALILVVVFVGGYSYLQKDQQSAKLEGVLDARNNTSFSTASTTTFINMGASQRLVATTSNRAYLIVCNDSAADMYLSFNDAPSTLAGNNVGPFITTRGCLEFSPTSGNLYTGSIRASLDTNAPLGTTTVTELVF